MMPGAVVSTLVAIPHPLNWYAGWSLILTAFVAGAVIGLAFHREDFLGGYTSFPRRLLRLGHIALAALGMINILFALSPVPAGAFTTAASICFLAGGVLMPAVCFLTAWRKPMRQLFFIPVTSLIAAVVLTLIGASS
jgi:hypothetical protein